MMPISHSENLQQAQLNMITQQLRTNGVLDEAILNLIQQTPRELFVPEKYRDVAYADMQIPLGYGQVMLTPLEEARFLQALAIQATDSVLEIGTGSGYMTALLAQQADNVVTVDIIEEFSARAQMKLAQFGVKNIHLQTGDASQSWNQPNTYDVIVITGSLPFLPGVFQESLRIGGRLIAIIGEEPVMEAVLITHQAENTWTEEKLFETVVPMLINAAQPLAFVF